MEYIPQALFYFCALRISNEIDPSPPSSGMCRNRIHCFQIQWQTYCLSTGTEIIGDTADLYSTPRSIDSDLGLSKTCSPPLNRATISFHSTFPSKCVQVLLLNLFLHSTPPVAHNTLHNTKPTSCLLLGKLEHQENSRVLISQLDSGIWLTD